MALLCRTDMFGSMLLISSSSSKYSCLALVLTFSQQSSFPFVFFFSISSQETYNKLLPLSLCCFVEVAVQVPMVINSMTFQYGGVFLKCNMTTSWHGMTASSGITVIGYNVHDSVKVIGAQCKFDLCILEILFPSLFGGKKNACGRKCIKKHEAGTESNTRQIKTGSDRLRNAWPLKHDWFRVSFFLFNCKCLQALEQKHRLQSWTLNNSFYRQCTISVVYVSAVLQSNPIKGTMSACLLYLCPEEPLVR